jgi:hypothetical protein
MNPKLNIIVFPLQRRNNQYLLYEKSWGQKPVEMMDPYRPRSQESRCANLRKSAFFYPLIEWTASYRRKTIMK